MFSYVHSTGVFVDDIEVALTFYVDTLGFEKRIDNMVSETERFVTIAPKGGQTEIGFNLRSAGETIPFPIALIVEDVDATCDLLKARNVDLTYGPADEPWGARAGAFKDPFGNEFYFTTA